MKQLIFFVIQNWFVLSILFAAVPTTQELSYPIFLSKRGDYYRSNTEIMRLRFHYPEDSRVFDLEGLKVWNEYQLENWEYVVQEVDRLLAAQKWPRFEFSESVSWQMKFLKVGSLLAQNRDEEAFETAKSLGFPATELPPRFSDIDQPAHPQKSKIYSAIVPGLGLAANGEYGAGIASFLLNGIFLYGTVTSWQQGKPATALLLFIFEWNWYFGGIEAAAEAADRKNKASWDLLRKQWLRRQGLNQ